MTCLNHLPIFYRLNYYLPFPRYSRENTDARISNIFASVVVDDIFGFSHSQYSDVIHRYDKDLLPSKYGHLYLRDNYFSPIRVLKQGGVDPILRGMIVTACQKIDTKASNSIRNYLFGTNTKGLDLVAMNIQRGRDHGIPHYNELRQQLGLGRKNSIEDISPDKQLVRRLRKLFNDDVDNIDAFVGGLAETHVEGGAVGELFATIIADQFLRLREGDRYWFENEKSNTGDKGGKSYRHLTMAELISRNSGVSQHEALWRYEVDAQTYRRHAFYAPRQNTSERIKGLHNEKNAKTFQKSEL